jgi:hypothetical protein
LFFASARELVKRKNLIAVIGDGFDGAKPSLCDRRMVDRFRQGQYVLPDLRGEPQHTHNLGAPGASDSLLSGDVGLIGDIARLQ